jgi:tetratricopeptide (TPR) repeat protein
MTEPEHITEVRKRATSLITQKRHPEAIKLLNQKSSEAWKYMRLSWDLGWCYFHLRRYNDARKHLLRANELAPDNPTCKWALGLVYLKQKEFAKAESLLTESLRRKDLDHVRGPLALAYLCQGKIAEAEATHLEGITLRPNSSKRYELYAAFLFDVGRHAEVERMNAKAKQLGSIN